MRKTVFPVLATLLALTAVRAQAAVLTVGPDGAFDTIQAALAAAGPSTDTHLEIRVQRGTYLENLRTPSPCCSGRLVSVTGGWNATFSSSMLDPTRTVVDGRDRGRVFTIANLDSGRLTIHNLTLREGLVRAGGVYGIGSGAGLRASLTRQSPSGGQLFLTRVDFRFNTIRGAAAGNAEAQGAGAWIHVNGGTLLVDRCRFSNNMIVPGDASLASYGGGLHLQMTGGAAVIGASDFVGNWAYGSRVSHGGGVYALVNPGGNAYLEMGSMDFEGNVVANDIGEGAGAAVRASGGPGATSVLLHHLRVTSHPVGQSQLHANVSANTRLELANSLVADGRGGVRVLANDAEAHMTNLTVANNQLAGIRGSVSSGGQLSVFNSIAFENAGGDLSLSGADVTIGNNLVGVDPRFVAPHAGDYAIDGASLAADAGFNTPPASFGFHDLAGRNRVFNGTVDIGAYEWHPF